MKLTHEGNGPCSAPMAYLRTTILSVTGGRAWLRCFDLGVTRLLEDKNLQRKAAVRACGAVLDKISD
jgi:hypothetical protein